MRNSILMTMIALPLLSVATYAGDNFSFASPSDSYGFSSEDWGSGSYLGVDTRDITPDRLAPLHLKDERGVEVTMVDQDAPAGKAGLKEQDVILTLNGSRRAKRGAAAPHDSRNPARTSGDPGRQP